jgi:hypothetical protein
LSFSESERKAIVESCRGIVERDLSSFASKRFNTFISNTWNVMNENNPPLRNTFFFVSEYRKAVYGVIPFLGSLDPDQMFWSPPGSADPKTTSIIDFTKRNLKWGIEYLRIVGLSLAVVESIALETGGDLPYETLVGPLRRGREHLPGSVGAFLSAKDSKVFSEGEQEVYLLLKNGRDLRARFDRKECAIGAYLYQNVPKDILESLYASAMKVSLGEIKRTDFLAELPYAALSEIVNAIARSAVIREKQFRELLAKFKGRSAA